MIKMSEKKKKYEGRFYGMRMENDRDKNIKNILINLSEKRNIPVNRLIFNYLEKGLDLSEEKEIYHELRRIYKHQSELSHPNLSSFKMRYGDLETDQLKNRVIDFPVWGGILSNDLIKPIIFTALQITLRAISIIKLIFIESSGSYEEEHKAIYEKYDAYIQSIKPKFDD